MLKKKLKYYLKETVIFIIVMTLFANALSYYKSQSLNKAPLDIQTFQLIDNTQFHPKKNKPLLIHFWATWCPTCKLEADNIQRLSQYYDVLTIAVQSKTDAEIKKYLHQHNLNFRVLNDATGKLAKHFHIAAYPTTFIYDSNHQLLFSDVGYTSTLGLFLRMWWAGL